LLEQTYLRAWAEVNDLTKALDSSEFGRACQCLLALTFKEIGYRVSHFQYVGRPDFVIERLNEGYSVEAKAPMGNKVIIKPQDLLGIEGLGHKPIVAVLTYPELATRWLIVDATNLMPRRYSKSDLTRFSNGIIEKEVSNAFSKIVVKFKERAVAGASELRGLLKE